MSRQVQEIFASIAPSYDFLNHFMSLSIDKKWREKALAKLKPKLQGPILDLCAGTLDLTQRLQEIFPNNLIVSVDFTLPMLEHGRNKLLKGRANQLICGDGHHLPLVNESMDAVICAFGIRNLEQRQQAIQEIYRVLKPGGQLVVLEFFRPSNFLSKLFYQSYGKFIIPCLGGFFSKNREAYRYLQNSILEFFSIEEYEDFLTDHHFESINSTALSSGIAYCVEAFKLKEKNQKK